MPGFGIAGYLSEAGNRLMANKQGNDLWGLDSNERALANVAVGLVASERKILGDPTNFLQSRDIPPNAAALKP